MKSAIALAVLTILVLLGLVKWSHYQRAQIAKPTGFSKIHSHNDYNQTRPLIEALDAGARSVEADINLVGDDLLVAHDIKNVSPDRSLQSMYLDPLRRLVQNNRGSVYGDDKPFVLLVEEKTEADVTYPVLRKLLDNYSDLLTHYTPQRTTPGPITIILTGHEPTRALLKAEPDRIVACDGNLRDLSVEPSPSADSVPWISGRWTDNFKWDGVGTMPDDERQKLRSFIEQAHAQHRTIRFWEAPDTEPTWAELQTDRIDWVNTDRLADCSAFLAKHPIP